MKAVAHVLVLTLVLAPSIQAQQIEKPPLVVTYVANEGFLIECAGKKILIDALFGGWESEWYYAPSDSVINLMTAAQPPFDSVDVIAVTHAHFDHFDPGIAAAHLKHNHHGILICPPKAAQDMETSAYYPEIKDRIRIVPAPGDLVVSMQLAGIGVQVLPTHHGPYMEKNEQTGETVDRHRNVQHLEFVFTIGGWKVFHCGDAHLGSLAMYHSCGLDSARIGLAFVAGRPREIIWPERIILMHRGPKAGQVDTSDYLQPGLREVLVAQRPMEKWTFR